MSDPQQPNLLQQLDGDAKHRFSNPKGVRDSVKAGVEAASEAPSPASEMSVLEKILEIRKRVGVVKKKGRNQEQKWDYLRIEDAVVSVNSLMAEFGLILTPTLQKKPDGSFCFDRSIHSGKDGPRGYIVSVVLRWSMQDVKTGDSECWDFPGEGYDTTDKGVYKAMTGNRKYAIINIFDLAVGNDVEERAAATFEDKVSKAKAVAASKIADAAGRGVKSAVEQYSQIEPERKVVIARPEQYNGHYVIASGFTAVPQLTQFFEDTASKYLDSAKTKTGKSGWKVSADYEKGLIALCEKLNIEVEG